MPMLEVASTAHVEPLIVPLNTAPLSGPFQVTLGASACAANGRPAERASETAALRRRTLLGNLGLLFIGYFSLVASTTTGCRAIYDMNLPWSRSHARKRNQ